MNISNWTLITFYGILLALFAILSPGQTTPTQRLKNTYDLPTADIFETPEIAEKCCEGKKWDGVQCLPFIE